MRYFGLLPTLACLAFAAPTTAQEQPSTPQPVAQYGSDVEARVAAVQRHIDAYRSRDMDTFMETFTPDAEIYMSGMVIRGHDEIRQLYSLNFAPGAPSFKIYDSDVTDRFVMLSAGFVLPNGDEVCCSAMEIEVTDGKVSYMSGSILVIYQKTDGTLSAR